MQTLGPWQRKYVDALRSGKFEKTQLRLCRIQDGQCSYCALGVMCELASEDNLIVADDAIDDYGIGMRYYDRFSYTRLPRSVMELFHARGIDGKLEKEIKGQNSLFELNDNTNITFPELADLIEQDPENFFKEPA